MVREGGGSAVRTRGTTGTTGRTRRTRGWARGSIIYQLTWYESTFLVGKDYVRGRVLLDTNVSINAAAARLVVDHVKVTIRNNFNAIPRTIVAGGGVVCRDGVCFAPLSRDNGVGNTGITRVVGGRCTTTNFGGRSFSSNTIVVANRSSGGRGTGRILTSVTRCSNGFVTTRTNSRLRSCLSNGNTNTSGFDRRDNVMATGVSVNNNAAGVSCFGSNSYISSYYLGVKNELIHFSGDKGTALAPRVRHLYTSGKVAIGSVSSFTRARGLYGTTTSVVGGTIFSYNDIPNCYVASSLPYNGCIPRTISFSNNITRYFTSYNNYHTSFNSVNCRLTTTVEGDDLSCPTGVVGSTSDPVETAIVNTKGFDVSVSKDAVRCSGIRLPVGGLRYISSFSEVNSRVYTISLPNSSIPDFNSLIHVTGSVTGDYSRLVRGNLPIIIIAGTSFSGTLKVYLHHILPPNCPFVYFSNISYHEKGCVSVKTPITNNGTIPIIMGALIFKKGSGCRGRWGPF